MIAEEAHILSDLVGVSDELLNAIHQLFRVAVKVLQQRILWLLCERHSKL